jgi:hypothetical protein
LRESVIGGIDKAKDRLASALRAGQSGGFLGTSSARLRR